MAGFEVKLSCKHVEKKKLGTTVCGQMDAKPFQPYKESFARLPLSAGLCICA